uniref:Uncharacterized protein n=1 Tax=Oryzias latipes TaxID=8090 RepID=A0A3B3HGU8_ORYLA
VVESPRPVHGNVRLLPVQLHSPSCPKRPGLSERQQSPLTALHLLAELGHVVWPYGSEELDVVVTVVFGHLVCGGFVKTYIDLHFSVEAIVQEEVVSHADPMWLHGVSLTMTHILTVIYYCSVNKPGTVYSRQKTGLIPVQQTGPSQPKCTLTSHNVSLFFTL